MSGRKGLEFIFFFLFVVLLFSLCAKDNSPVHDHSPSFQNKVYSDGSGNSSGKEDSKISDEYCDCLDNDGDGMIDEADEDIPFSVFVSREGSMPGKLQKCVKTESGYPYKGTYSGYLNGINWSVTYYVINSADELNELCKNTSYGADDFEKYVDFATQTIIVFVFSATVPIVSVDLCWAKVFNLIGYVGRIGDNIFVKWNGYMFFIYQQPDSGVCPLVVYQPVQLPPPYYNAIITHKKICSRSLIVKYVDSILYIGGSLDIDEGLVVIYNIDRLLEDYCPASPESRVLPEECVICLRKMRESGGPPERLYYGTEGS